MEAWKKRVQNHVKFSQGTLSPNESCQQDIQKAQDRCQTLCEEIIRRAKNLANSDISSKLTALANNQLNNTVLMEMIYENLEH